MPTVATRRSSNDDLPLYRALAPLFLEDETLHDVGTEIIYLGDPNEHMEPLNEAARERSEAYMQQLEDGARQVAQLNGRQYRGRSRDLGDQVFDAMGERPREQKVILPRGGDNVPVRPDMVPVNKRRLAGADKVVSAKPASVKKQGPVPIAVHGTHYDGDAATESGL